MWFRLFLVGWTTFWLMLLGWLATHRSSAPTILGRYSTAYFALLIILAGLSLASLLAQSSFIYPQLYAKRRELLLALTSFTLSLLAAEWGIRVLDPLGISYYEESLRYHLEKISDPVLVYKHAPGLRRTYQGVEVTTNEWGLRDRALTPKQADELRILLLGDSVTFGWGVPVEATFGRKLETILSAQLARPVRTVNTGVGSYNTVQEYAVLKTYADAIEPDLVLLLYVDNDINSNNPPFDPWSKLSLQGKSPPEALTILLRKSWLYRLGEFTWQHSFAKRPTKLDPRARGMQESMEALGAIAHFCQERGLPFVAFYLRPIGEPLAGFSAAMLAELQSCGQSHGFPVVDVGPWWAQGDRRLLTNSVVDAHPNARGHEILAKGMAEYLITQGLMARVPAAAP